MCGLIRLDRSTFGQLSWRATQGFLLGESAVVTLTRPEKAGGQKMGDLPLRPIYLEDEMSFDGTPPKKVAFRANLLIYRWRVDVPESTATAKVTLQLIPVIASKVHLLLLVGAKLSQPAWDTFNPTLGFMVEGKCDLPLLAIWAWQQWKKWWQRKQWYSVPRAF